ncbi:hypothetical protein OIF97_08775 [Neisseria meningitidis]|nr:hypothetical protein [Neisseria meningitidis]MCV6710650.1 hypothetical protein [Neisseria meningitidis]MCV6712800.1 hypothetical protein [Neisseria meningitidis]
MLRLYPKAPTYRIFQSDYIPYPPSSRRLKYSGLTKIRTRQRSRRQYR